MWEIFGESLVCSSERIKAIVRNVNCEAKVFQTFQGVGKKIFPPSTKGVSLCRCPKYQRRIIDWTERYSLDNCKLKDIFWKWPYPTFKLLWLLFRKGKVRTSLVSTKFENATLTNKTKYKVNGIIEELPLSHRVHSDFPNELMAWFLISHYGPWWQNEYLSKVDLTEEKKL